MFNLNLTTLLGNINIFKKSIPSPVRHRDLISFYTDTYDEFSKGDTYYRIRDIFAEDLAACDFHYIKGEGLDTLLKNGLRTLLKEAAMWVQDNECGGWQYIQFNDCNNFYSPLALWDQYNLSPILFTNPPLYNDQLIDKSRLIEIPDLRRPESHKALVKACHALDTALALLRESNKNSKKLIFSDTKDLAAGTPSGNTTRAEKESIKRDLKSLKKGYIRLGKNKAISILDMKDGAILELVVWAVKYISFLTGISSVRLGFSELVEDAINIDDRFYQMIASYRKTFIAPIIYQLQELLNLPGEWSFKAVQAINEKEQEEANAKRASSIHIFINTMALAREKGLNQKILDSIDEQYFNTIKGAN